MDQPKQHDWYTPEGRKAAWAEIERTMPDLLAEAERLKHEKEVANVSESNQNA